MAPAAARAEVDASQAMGGLAAMVPQRVDKLAARWRRDAGQQCSALLAQVMEMPGERSGRPALTAANDTGALYWAE